MINVNQITSQLAMMPDQALQKYAMLNKNDPYTVSLALSESNRRKAMREGATPMPGQMPKVVDQDIAQMAAPPQQPMMPPQARPQMPPQQAQQQLPENTGIGQLPAQNMQGMADGGIVGYADGGHIPSYAGNTDGSFVYRNSYQYNPNQIQLTNPDGTPMTAAQLNALPESERMRIAKEMREQTGRGPAPTGYSGITYAPYGNAPQTRTPTQNSLAAIHEQQMQLGQTSLGKNPQTRLMVGEGLSGIDLGGPGAMPGTGGGANPTTGTPVSTGASTDVIKTRPGAQPAKPGATTGATAANPAAPTGGIDTLKQESDAIARLKNNMVGSTEKPIDESVFLKRMSDISQPAYDKANSMIEKEKGRLKEGKEQDFYMSLIEGGLAAASETGPHALQNIAKGFSKGAASYRDALKDFRKASQENAKMELELTRAEAADKKGDIKTMYERMDQYENRKAKRDDTINSGIAQIINTSEHGKTQKDIAHISGGYQLEAEKMRNASALAVASMPGANERLFSTLGGGDVAKGLEKYQAAQTDKTGLGFAKLYVDHVAESNKAGATPMTEGAFLDTMTRLAAQFNPKTVTDPKQGNLYSRP
jgi:hypothetical protein